MYVALREPHNILCVVIDPNLCSYSAEKLLINFPKNSINQNIIPSFCQRKCKIYFI